MTDVIFVCTFIEQKFTTQVLLIRRQISTSSNGNRDRGDYDIVISIRISIFVTDLIVQAFKSTAIFILRWLQWQHLLLTYLYHQQSFLLRSITASLEYQVLKFKSNTNWCIYRTEWKGELLFFFVKWMILQYHAKTNQQQKKYPILSQYD